MDCATVKEGTFCTFMTNSGCSFNGGSCYPVVEQCQGCSQIMKLVSGEYCRTYGNPASKWTFGRCNFATHLKGEKKREEKKVNPLKASKRSKAKAAG